VKSHFFIIIFFFQKDAGKRERQRRVFTHDEYIGLVLRSGQFMTHDYSHQSTKEDPRMMAFFDSLVQREIEGWSSEDAPTVPHTPSDSEINPATGEPFSGTDIDGRIVFWKMCLILSL
jgi:WD repeat-containing protein 22